MAVDDVEFALLKQAVTELRAEASHLESELHEMKALDSRRLRSAVVSLGAIALSLASYIWFLFNGGPVQ